MYISAECHNHISTDDAKRHLHAELTQGVVYVHNYDPHRVLERMKTCCTCGDIYWSEKMKLPEGTQLSACPADETPANKKAIEQLVTKISNKVKV